MSWQKEIMRHLNSADIILLLVSPDFLASEYCYSTEMAHVMKRYERGEVQVVPIILRYCVWQEAPFGELQVLPKDAKPVISPAWHTQDEAFTNVAQGIQKILKDLVQRTSIKGTSSQTATFQAIQPLQHNQSPPEPGIFNTTELLTKQVPAQRIPDMRDHRTGHHKVTRGSVLFALAAFLIIMISSSISLIQNGLQNTRSFQGSDRLTSTAISQTNATRTTRANTTATAVAQISTETPQDIYAIATSENPAIDDPLNQQNDSKWDSYKEANNSCGFTRNAYRITMAQSDLVSTCFAKTTNFSNFAFQVRMRIISGDGAGIIFRTSDKITYRFRVSSDGSYDLVVGPRITNPVRLISGTSDHIALGLNQINVLTVVVIKDDIYLYVNDYYLDKAKDKLSLSGQIGLFAVDFENSTEVLFYDAKVWKLAG